MSLIPNIHPIQPGTQPLLVKRLPPKSLKDRPHREQAGSENHEHADPEDERTLRSEGVSSEEAHDIDLTA